MAYVSFFVKLAASKLLLNGVLMFDIHLVKEEHWAVMLLTVHGCISRDIYFPYMT